MTKAVGLGNITAFKLEQIHQRFVASAMVGKLLNLAPDLNEVGKVEEGDLKSRCDGSLIVLEEKYKPHATGKLDCRLAFACNHFPHFTDRSGGVWRRMIIMPCDVVIPETDPKLVEQYENELAAELPGFSNKIVSAARRLVAARRFPIPAASARAVADQRQEANPAVTFCSEKFEVTGASGDSIYSDYVYRLYERWIRANGFKGQLTMPNFWREFRTFFAKEICGGAVRGRGKPLPGTASRPWEWRGVKYLPGAPSPDEFDVPEVLGTVALLRDVAGNVELAVQDGVVMGGRQGIAILTREAEEADRRAKKARSRAVAGDAPESPEGQADGGVADAGWDGVAGDATGCRDGDGGRHGGPGGRPGGRHGGPGRGRGGAFGPVGPGGRGVTRRKEDAIETELLDIHQVAKLLAISETTVLRYDGRDGFPRSVVVKPVRARRWRSADVRGYIEGLGT